MLRVVVIVFALLFSVNVWAGPTNKSNSLTIDKDPVTNNWTATCDISVSGVENNQIYSGVMLFEFAPSGHGATPILNALFQIDPANRIWTDSSPGAYKISAKLKGHDVLVHAEVKFNSINAGDRIFCSSRIDQGVQPPAVTLFGANMVSTVQQP